MYINQVTEWYQVQSSIRNLESMVESRLRVKMAEFLLQGDLKHAAEMAAKIEQMHKAQYECNKQLKKIGDN